LLHFPAIINIQYGQTPVCGGELGLLTAWLRRDLGLVNMVRLQSAVESLDYLLLGSDGTWDCSNVQTVQSAVESLDYLLLGSDGTGTIQYVRQFCS